MIDHDDNPEPDSGSSPTPDEPSADASLGVSNVFEVEETAPDGGLPAPPAPAAPTPTSRTPAG